MSRVCNPTRWLALASTLLLLAPSTPVRGADAAVPPELLDERLELPEEGEREAAAVLRFTVRADGTTADVEIVEGFYTPEFATALIDAVKDWTFTPGTYNGEPVEWHHYDFQLQLSISDGSPSITPEFRDAFTDVTALIERDDLAAAAERLRELERETATLLFEYAFLNDSLFSVYLGLERPHAAMAAIRKATRAGDSAGDDADSVMLPEDMFTDALRKRFLIEASLGFNADALETYARLARRTGERPDGDRSAEQAAAIREVMTSELPLSAQGTLEDDPWVYRTARRAFTLTDIDGTLSHIDVLCARRRTTLGFQPDVEWALPESWGDCGLEFHGEPGTTFTIVEFAD